MKVYEVFFSGGHAVMVLQKMHKKKAYAIKWDRYERLTAISNTAKIIEASDEWEAAEIFAGEPLRLFKVYLDDYESREPFNRTSPADSTAL